MAATNSNPSAGAVPTGPPVKPDGGYAPVAAGVLAAAWRAYKKKRVGLLDLRVWFAALEAAARRRPSPAAGAPKRFEVEELRRLVGGPARRVRAALRALGKAGLLTWSAEAVGVPDSAEGLPLGGEDPAEFSAFLAKVPNPRRKVPAPRRLLRSLAGGATAATAATALAHLIRGLYLKGGRCLGGGSLKASWVAEVFGVAPRRVKAARKALIESGWVVPVASDQRSLNRRGARFLIDLGWSPPRPPSAPAPDRPRPCPKMAPPRPVSCPKMAPPLGNNNLPFGEFRDQKPAPGGPDGFSRPDPEGVGPGGLVHNEPPPPRPPGPAVVHNEPPPPTPAPASVASALRLAIAAVREAPPPPRASGPASAPAPASTPAAAPAPKAPAPAAKAPAPKAPGAPDLRRVVAEDLEDAGRLLAIHAQAAAAGLVSDSEHGRLRVAAAAERARAVGTTNPCGMFVRLVRSGLWSHLTGRDEDAANARLKRHLHGPPPEPSPASPPSPWALPLPLPGPRPPQPPPRPAPPALSGDAASVRAVLAAAARSGYRGDPFPLACRGRPGWTRERWDRAAAELASASLRARLASLVPPGAS